MKTISERAYDKYCLDWMMDHGYSLDDFVTELHNMWEEVVNYTEPEDFDVNETSPNELYRNWWNDCGFDGGIFVCYDEFINAEYGMAYYMKQLLTESEYLEYLADPLRFGDDYDE